MAADFKPISILVVDDEKMIRVLLGDTLNALGYRSMVADGYDQAIEILKEKPVDVVITDIKMPVKSGLELIKYVKDNYSNIPVLAISGKGPPESSIFKQGADGFIAKPFRIGVIEDMIIKTLMKYDVDKFKTIVEKKKILIVDDEPSIVSTLVDSLEALGYDSVGVSSAFEALAELDKVQFDLVITDIRMPEKTGIELLSDIKSKYNDLPVVIITGYPLAYPPEKAMSEGADGYIPKPFRINQIDSLLAKLLYNYDPNHEPDQK